ncbi:MAG: hypothetical protein PHW52_03100 [Candidatus Pacebacteria bacterium]|nr:hypothetical protein [Candidatus Paceibacterota bacterium]
MELKKKILVFLLSVVGFFTIFSTPMIVSAASPLDGCTISDDNLTKLAEMGITTCESRCRYANADNQCGACCILNAIFNLTDWLFIGLMAISALMIMYGAFLFVTAGQEPAKADKGRQLLLFACIGIAIAFFSRALPSLVRLMLGV